MSGDYRSNAAANIRGVILAGRRSGFVNGSMLGTGIAAVAGIPKSDSDVGSALGNTVGGAGIQWGVHDARLVNAWRRR